MDLNAHRVTKTYGSPEPPTPFPEKSKVIVIAISIWIPRLDGPPLQNVGPALDPWESIVFSAIKPLPPPPLCKIS